MKTQFVSILALVLILWSCNDAPENPLGNDPILISTDSETLSQRINRDGSGVVSIINPSTATGRQMEAQASPVPLVLISQVDAPSVDGRTLRATHVDIDGKYAYVSYNTEGEIYLGAVEIFDISDVYNPKITAQAIFKEADISSLEFKNGVLYLAAAVNIDANKDVTAPANLITVAVSGGVFTSPFKFSSVPGFVATDVAHTNTHTVVTSGNDGSVSLFDGNQTLGQSVKIDDLRAVAFGSDKIAVLSGTGGVSVLDPNSLSTVLSIPLANDVAEAKRTLSINQNHLFVSEGRNGAGIYQMGDGKLVKRMAIPILPNDVEAGDVVTNAVSVDQDLLFMANGAAGISIADVKDKSSIKEFGVLDLDGSSNFVRNEQKFVFVATGAGGLQIIKINKEETSPTQNICQGLATYSGSSWVNINSGETRAFSGSASLDGLNNNSNFLFCGSLAIQSQFNLNSGSTTEVYGSFAFGRLNGGTQMNVNSKLKLSGSIVIYGDINLNSGASIEFVGTGNSITIYGRVNKNNNVTITGNFTDTEGKLK